MSRWGLIHHMTSHMSVYIMIRFYDIIIAFLLDANSNEYVSVCDYGFIDGKKPPILNKKQKKKLWVSISEKLLKLNKKTRKKTERLDQWKTFETWWENKK